MSAKRRSHHQRLKELAERTLKAMEEQDEAPSPKDLNSIYRLPDRLRADLEFEKARELARG